MYDWENLNGSSRACDDEQCWELVHTESPYGGRGHRAKVCGYQVQ